MAVMAKPKPQEVKAALIGSSSVSRPDLDKVFLNVLDEMMILYYPPFRAASDDELLEQAVIGARAYVDDLAEFSSDALAVGWRSVRRAHKLERWPTINTIRDACGSVAPARRIDPYREKRQQEIDEQRRVEALADQWTRNAVGDRAAREGWLLALVEFIKSKGREPSDGEIERARANVMQRRKDAEGGFAVCLGVQIDVGRDTLLRAHRHWEQKNGELCRRALGVPSDEIAGLVP